MNLFSVRSGPAPAMRTAAAVAAGLAALLAWNPVLAADPEPPARPAMSEPEIIRHVLPSVVNITIWKSEPEAAEKTDEAKPPEQFYGSGFVVDPSGLILTNRHVVDGAQDIVVTFSDGTRLGAKLCAASSLVDLAMVKIAPKDKLPAVTWGDSDKLSVGDRVFAIGNPLGVGLSASSGIVSALHRRVSANPFDDFIQTDAAINHGNSGGALVDAWGNVVGVNTAFLSDRSNGGSLGVGFAIPSFEASHAADRFKGCDYKPPGWIGVTVQEVTPDIAMAVGLPKPAGSIITGITPDSPAKQAGLQEGDVLLSVNGMSTPTPVTVLGYITLAKAGTEVGLGYWRDGQASEVPVTVRYWPGMEGSAGRGKMQAAAMKAMNMGGLGVRLADRPGPSGPARVVVARVDPGSGASDAGLQSGDVVLRIERQPAVTADGVQAALREAQQAGRHSVLLLVESAGRRRFVTMPLGVG